MPAGIARFFPIHSEQSTQGLPKEQLLPVVEGIRKRVAAIRDALAQLEVRIVGGSFLVMYEGDLERAKQGLALLEGEGVKEENTKPSAPCLVKLIDFAYVKLVTGEGPDRGVLLGMDTTLKLLDGRIAQIKAS